MIKQIETKDGLVSLNTDILYSGSDAINDYEKSVRKLLGLPLTKQLVYYADKTNDKSVIEIKEFKIAEIYTKTNIWCTLELVIDGIGQKINIHSDFFAEMQKPSFISDMKIV